jgi:SpoVK/Ycf46/Vps4 family AAA+-type ATPase
LILLHGPPGTGKTTLCQGLAQKISIRLNSVYKRTSLIQIKAAALLSKYYSESAKQVDKIFTTLQQMCEEDPEEFICVLIDEVETIAITREASAHGESQESLRATNAFLTGLDRTKGYPNIAFLCTSNMVGSLDPAFLDRCGLKLAVEPPSLASQYAILRGRIQKLMTRRIIFSETVLPSHRDAEIDRNIDPELPGAKLLQMIELMNPASSERKGGAISGRSLTQLPEQALLRYLRGEDCDLDMALRLILQYIQAEESQAMREDSEIGAEDDPTEEMVPIFEGSLRKRDGATTLKEDEDIDQALGVMGDLIAELRDKRRRVASQAAKGVA